LRSIHPTTSKNFDDSLVWSNTIGICGKKRSEMLAPLTDLAGECGETKTTKKNKTKKKPWRWESIHQQAFDNVKATIAREVVLAYPDFTKPFEIYTDASTM
jgi:hypothetical protein